MGLMISSIAKIGNNIMPKGLFSTNSDFYLFVLEYGDFDFRKGHNYSTDFHDSEMTRILDNYRYGFESCDFEKIASKTFHSDNKIMSWRNIFDVENLDFNETRPARVTPTFLFTTVKPNCIKEINIDNIANEIFVYLKFQPNGRDANCIPQLINEILSNSGLTLSKCKRSNISTTHENVYFFDYNLEVGNINKEILGIVKSIKEDTTEIKTAQEELIIAIKKMTDDQTSKLVTEINAWVTTVAIELTDELACKLDQINKTDDMQMKLELSVPFISLLGVNFKTEFDIKSWTKKMYEKYSFEIFKLIEKI